MAAVITPQSNSQKYYPMGHPLNPGTSSIQRTMRDAMDRQINQKVSDRLNPQSSLLTKSNQPAPSATMPPQPKQMAAGPIMRSSLMQSGDPSTFNNAVVNMFKNGVPVRNATAPMRSSLMSNAPQPAQQQPPAVTQTPQQQPPKGYLYDKQGNLQQVQGSENIPWNPYLYASQQEGGAYAAAFNTEAPGFAEQQKQMYLSNPDSFGMGKSEADLRGDLDRYNSARPGSIAYNPGYIEAISEKLGIPMRTETQAAQTGQQQIQPQAPAQNKTASQPAQQQNYTMVQTPFGQMKRYNR